MTTPSASLRWARGYVRVARGDSLVRNSLYLMLTTVETAGLGYVFWIVAARMFSTAQVGIASAVISLCSTVALLTYLGPAAMLVERLHTYQRPRAWKSFFARMCVATAAVTALLATVTVPLIAHAKGYGSYFSAAGAAVLAVTGAAVWTVVQMCCNAFIAARRAVFPGYFRLITELAMGDGIVWTTSDRDAAALWLPGGAEAPTPPADYSARLAAVTTPWTGRFTAFDAAVEAGHPAEAHWHLAILAVRPDTQGLGVGTALLGAGHQHIDRDYGTPAYLEAATPRLAAWYQRHGYSPCDPAIDLPDGGPQMYPMLRPAAPQYVA